VWEWDGDTWICVLPTTASIDAQVATLIEEARRAGDAQGDIATCVCKLQQAAAMKPADGDVQIELATALWTLGDMDAARQAVDRALQSNPHSGRAHFVMAQVQLLEGDRDAARSTVLQALEDDVLETPDQRIALSLTLVSILMRAGAFAEAARFLEKQRPELGLLDELPGPRNVEDSMDSSDPGWQVVGAYAHVLAELGQRERAQTLLRRLAPINESSLRRLRGGGLSALDHWTLAAAGAGRIPDDMALVHLEQAFDAGLLLTWRYRFGQHPCLWPLWKTRDFGNLLQRMDAEMARQRQR
jgi:tetratricopeptide (TPR) repeat protein